MRLLIWGTGRLTGKVVGRWIKLDDIIGFVDNKLTNDEYMGKKVYKPSAIRNLDYDALVVCNLFSQEIYEQCLSLQLDMTKNIYLYNNCQLQDLNEDYEFVEAMLGKEYADIVQKRYHVVRGTEAYGDLCIEDTKFNGQNYIDTDYVRIKCFELVVKEIRKRKLKGAVAEAGVFRGEFAQYINHAFPDSKLYLFDTFEGFNASEALNEVRNGNATDSFIEAYKNTDIKIVLDRMTYLDNVIIRQGFFPQTAEGIKEEFIFSSIDMDFEESIYEGIKYFYPKTVEGGYIFVHDYNSSLRGVEKAIDRYEREAGIVLHKMPICDANGTLVICK